MKIYCNHKYTLVQKNKIGYLEKVVYTGSLKNKPKGWKVIK